MWQIQITDPTLKQAIMTHMIDRIDRGGMDDLLAAGVDPDFIDELRRRSVRDLGEISRSDQLQLGVQIDPSVTRTCLARLDMRRRDQELMESFIRMGATADLLHKLFRMSKADFHSYRRMLTQGDSGFSCGRTRQIPEAERDEIHRVWSKLTADGTRSFRDCFTELFKQYPDVHVNALYLAVREYDELAAEKS